MTPGFQSKIVEVVTQDGRNFKLLKPVTYVAADGRVFVIPAGASTDGASVPSSLWPLLPPFGDYWLAAYLHDSAYQNTLKTDSGAIAGLSKEQCDLLLKEAMQSLGVPLATVAEIYEGVAIGGWKAFKQDRS